MADRDTTYAVKERVLETAQRLMVAAGIQVTEMRAGDRITLDIFLPPDSADPHGDRFKAVLDAQQRT